MKRVTPLKAIRHKCLDCSGGSRKEVYHCQFENCSLYPYRLGRGKRASLKKIRAYCLWCCNGQRQEVRLCPSVRCSLWEYRFGKRPQKSFLSKKTPLETGGLEANFKNMTYTLS